MGGVEEVGGRLGGVLADWLPCPDRETGRALDSYAGRRSGPWEDAWRRRIRESSTDRRGLRRAIAVRTPPACLHQRERGGSPRPPARGPAPAPEHPGRPAAPR